MVLLANRGVGASTGVVPPNVTDMTRDVLRFIDALELKQVDVLGFSLGGYISQELALLRPRQVRRIVLAGTAPQGAPNIHRWTDDVYPLATPDEVSADRFISLFFSGSEESRADPSKLSRLAAITQPAFVANGDNDTMMHTENSYVLAHHLPNAQLRIYPDSGHGFLDQLPGTIRRPRQGVSQRRLAARSRGGCAPPGDDADCARCRTVSGGLRPL